MESGVLTFNNASGWFRNFGTLIGFANARNFEDSFDSSPPVLMEGCRLIADRKVSRPVVLRGLYPEANG
jgi:hypothetical protein